MAECFIGQIIMVGFNFAPSGFYECNGQTVPLNANQALYAVLGTSYGGDGRTTVGIPDLRGRVPVGMGFGGAVSTGALPQYLMGAKGGVLPGIQLTVAQLPPHNHAAAFNGNGGSTPTVNVAINASTMAGTDCVPDPAGARTLAAPNWVDSSFTATNVLGYVNDPSPSVPLVGVTVTQTGGGGGQGTVTIGNTGSDAFINVMPAYQVVNYIIANTGIFPIRN